MLILNGKQKIMPFIQPYKIRILTQQYPVRVVNGNAVQMVKIPAPMIKIYPFAHGCKDWPIPLRLLD